MMEANSLSDIIQLAANPPKYPRNPTERPRDNLTLYIARVPGSRDIILTTLKPQLKIVTAEDVATSLYYFHLNTEDDKRLLGDGITEEANVVTQKPLPRRPLPESARSSLDVKRHTAPSPATQYSDLAFSKRQPNIAPGAASQIQAQGDRPIPRKPLGPRPPKLDHSLAQNPLPGVENNPPSLSTNTYLEAQSPRNGRASVQAFKPHETISDASGSMLAAVGFSITVIRRDPSTGSQWNIGSIIGKPAFGDQQSGQETSMGGTGKPYFDISVHLTTPGYTCFRGSHASGYTGLSQTPQQHVEASSNDSFDRRICMEGSSFWNGSSMKHSRTRSEITDSRARGRSSDSETVGSSEANSRVFDERHDTKGSHSKGYMFYSPWGGRCKFATGSGGRSLRCKHTLPASLSSGAIEGVSNQSNESMLVSELRFNLPSSAVFSPFTSERNSTNRSIFPKFGRAREKISPSKITPLPPSRLQSTSYSALYPSDDDLPSLLSMQDPRPSTIKPSIVSTSPNQNQPHIVHVDQIHNIEGSAEGMARLDLSLGKEKAGGGNRGKRAKLGKLVIQSEGFKMLDLLVSANLGIWWSVWKLDDR